MANQIQFDDSAAAAVTITLASLANGAGRQSTMITNTDDAPAALVAVKLTSGSSAPTAGTCYRVHLLRGDGHATVIRDDGAGADDAAITVLNAPLLGAIVVTNSASTAFTAVFDTSHLGALGPSWGIAIHNATGQALNSTEGNHAVHYVLYRPEIQ